MKNPLLLVLLVLILAVAAWVAFSEGDSQPGDSSLDSGATALNDPAPGIGGDERGGNAPAAPIAGATPTDRVAIEGQETPALAIANPASISLRVVDGRGDPVQGVEAKLRHPDQLGGFEFMIMLGDAFDDSVASTESNANGQVRFNEVEPGKPVEVVLSARHWQESKVWVAPLSPSERRALGEHELTPGTWIHGTVMNPAGELVAGAEVSLTAGEPPASGFVMAGHDSGYKRFSDHTDENGRFSFHGMPSDRYALHAKQPGYLSASESGIEIRDETREHKAELELGKGDFVSGRVVDASGNGIANARVVRMDTHGFAPGMWDRGRILRQGIETDANGRFQIGGMVIGDEFRLAASAEGYAVKFSDKHYGDREIEIPLLRAVDVTGYVVNGAGARIPDALVKANVANAGPHAGPRVDRTNAEGEFSFEGLAVGDYELALDSWAGESQEVLVQIVEGMDPLEIEVRGVAPVTVRLVDDSGAPVPNARVTVSKRRTQMGGIRMSRSVNIESDGSGETFVDDGTLRIRGRTDSEGNALFYSLPAGSWSAKAEIEGFAPGRADFERIADRDQEVELVLLPAGALRVSVVDTLGIPMARAPINLNPLGNSPKPKHTQIKADDQGLAVWTNLAPGEYEVLAADTSGPSLINFHGDDDIDIDLASVLGAPKAEPEPGTPVEVKSDETAELKLVLSQKAMVRVQVLREGAPVTGAEVRLEKDNPMRMFSMGGDDGKSVKTDANGWAELPPSDPGTYKLTARAKGSNPETEREVEVTSGRQELRIDLPSGSVRGVVLGLDGGASGARVKLIPRETSSEDGAPTASVGSFVVVSMDGSGGADPMVDSFQFEAGETVTMAGADGSFAFEDVPEGSYVLKVSSKGYAPWESGVFDTDGRTEHDAGTATLETAGSIEGRVLNLPPLEDDDGPGTIRLLQLLTAEGSPVTVKAIGSDGRYRFDNLEPGKYQLRFGDGAPRLDSGTISEVIEVNTGSPTQYDFVLP